MRRLHFLRSLVALPALPGALAAQPLATPAAGTRALIYYGFVRGLKHGIGYDILEKLRPGAALTLLAEPDNAYDAQAVRVDFEGKKIGYLPRESNRTISLLLAAGTALQAEVSHVNPKAKDWQVVRLGVYQHLPAAAPEALTQVPAPVYDGAYLENHYTERQTPSPYDYQYDYAEAEKGYNPRHARRTAEPALPGYRVPVSKRDPQRVVVVDRRHLPPGITLEQVLAKSDAGAQRVLDGVDAAEHLITLKADKLGAWADHLAGTVELVNKKGNRIAAWLLV